MKGQVKDYWIIIFSAIVFFLCLQSCKPPQVAIARTDTVERVKIVERVHDSALYLTDSAGFRALLECDSLGRIRVKQVEAMYAGQFVKPRLVVKDNIVNVACVIDSARVYFSWKEHDTTRMTRTSTTIVNRVNYLTGWQWAQVYAGRISAGIIVLLLIFFAIETYLKSKTL